MGMFLLDYISQFINYKSFFSGKKIQTAYFSVAFVNICCLSYLKVNQMILDSTKTI